MFTKIKNYWENNGFLVCLIGSLAVIFLIWLFWQRNKEKGTYSTQYYYDFRDKTAKKRSRNEGYDSGGGGGRETGNGKGRDSKGETECRTVLQQIFRKPFSKTRPKFMFNSVTGSNLELDMFDRDLMLAVEYNGRQHYEYVPYFHRSRESFQNQKYRDRMKRESCRKLDINLIEVPYTVKNHEIEGYLIGELRKLDYET